MSKWIYKTYYEPTGSTRWYDGYSFAESVESIFDGSGEYCVGYCYTTNYWDCNCKNIEDKYYPKNSFFWKGWKLNDEKILNCEQCKSKRPDIPNKKKWWF